MQPQIPITTLQALLNPPTHLRPAGKLPLEQPHPQLSHAGPSAFLFPKTDMTAPLLSAAMRSRQIDEVTAEGGGGSASMTMTSPPPLCLPLSSQPEHPSTAAKARGALTMLAFC